MCWDRLMESEHEAKPQVIAQPALKAQQAEKPAAEKLVPAGQPMPEELPEVPIAVEASS